MPISPFTVPPGGLGLCQRCDYRHATRTIPLDYGTLTLCDACIGRSYRECGDCELFDEWGNFYTVRTAHDEYGNDDDDDYDDRPPLREVCRRCIRGVEYAQCSECAGYYDASGNACCRPRFAPMSNNPVPHVFPHCGCRDLDLCADAQRRGHRPPAVDGDNAMIHSYSHRPVLDFKGATGDPGQPFFGVEIELTAGDPRRMVREAAALLGHHFYFKSDGSISRGFELVTHPMSYSWAMNEWPWHGWEILAARGIGSDETTGMHIHVNKLAFGAASHDLRWLTFFYRNRAMVEKIARRNGSSYARFDGSESKLIVPIKKTGIQRCGKCDVCLRFGNRRNSYGEYECRHRLQRYAAINLTNEYTYEARVFASSIHPVHIKGALALMASTIEYTRTLTSAQILKQGGYDWNVFLEWVAERPEYAPLTDCLADIDKNGNRA